MNCGRPIAYLIIAFFALAVLSGCIATSQLTPAEEANLTPAAKVFGLQGEFDILLRAFNIYNEMPRCSAVVVVACSDRAVVATAREIIIEARAILITARATVRANPGSEAAVIAATALRAVIARFSTHLMVSKVRVQT